jgi:PTS system mannose-specific IID component
MEDHKKELFPILWRSLFLQAIWNFERLQNIGFAYALLPFLNRLYRDPEKRKEAVLRHIGFFNTHPYMVNIVFGLVAHLEEEIQAGKPVRPEEVTALKNSIAGPLAAIGDTFFWATWRPFAALLAISLGLFFHSSSSFSGTFLSPLVFILVFNTLHLPFRYWSASISYQLRDKIIDIIANFEFQYAVDMVRFSGIVLLAVTLLFYFWAFGEGLVERVIFLIVFLVTVLIGYLRVSPGLLFYGAIAVSIALAY